MKVVHTIAPFYDENSEALILGSFPSVKSREQGFFYGNEKNRFWKVLSELFGEDEPKTVLEKKSFLKRRRIALYDVVFSCEIEGSSDSKIKNVVPSDIDEILKNAKIKAIFLNGKKAAELFDKYFSVEVPVKVMPSTSPANAAFSKDRLIDNWKELQSYLDRQIKDVTAEKKPKGEIKWQK